MLRKIMLIFSLVLLGSSVNMVHNFYSAQSNLSIFLKDNGIFFKNNLNSTFIILDQSKFLLLLKYNVNIVWYKIEKNKIIAVIKPSEEIVQLLQPTTIVSNKCNVIIVH